MLKRKSFGAALCVLAMVAMFAQVVSAQQRTTRQQQPEDFGITMPETVTPAAANTPVALESTVDPNRYFVGPSDVISVNIWMSPPFSFPLTVTPEGTLIIPTVGEVRVADLTLAKAKERILAEARKKYLKVEITATLIRPRPIVVSVSGNVLNPGLYTLYAVDRANKAIDEANKLGRTQLPEDLATVQKDMSRRNIVITHRDGSQDRVDLPKYFATHEEKWNPYLREGDVIVVPKTNPLKNVFAIYGEVNAPGRYEFVDGDSVADAVKIAQGMTRFALAEKAIFSRLNPDGTSLATETIDIPAIMSGKAPDIALQIGDRIVIQGKNDLRADYNVDVKGEVEFPATYPITKNRTHLSEIIHQAGGFTEYASLADAQLYRQTYRPDELNDERLMSMRGGIATQDSAGFGVETELRLTREAVNVDFRKLFLGKDTTQDVILQPEDQIIIPSLRQTIYVYGQVASPGHVPFVAGKDPDYYVKKAGGFTDRASGGDLKIIKGKTKQWVSPGETTIEDGDYIWVPTEPDHPFSYYMTIASQAASVISVVIGVAVVIIQVTKP